MDAADKFHSERVSFTLHFVHDGSGPRVYMFIAKRFADRICQFRFIGVTLEIHHMIPELCFHKSGISRFSRGIFAPVTKRFHKLGTLFRRDVRVKAAI